MSDVKPPIVENAPGLVWRVRKHGWEARWQARTDLVIRGYSPKSIQVWKIDGNELGQGDQSWISKICNRMQDDMLTWAHGGVPKVGAYDGTLRDLVNVYQLDPVSPFAKVRFATRNNYVSMLKQLMGVIPQDLAVKDIRPREVYAWHQDWSQRGNARAHGMMSMLRMVISFGAIMLECEDCQRVRGLLSGMRFKMNAPRDEALSVEQANAIRAEAHRAGFPEIALAQAFQFECTLRQKDVIGEWVPMSEPGPLSDIHDTRYGVKWIRGIQWQEIDDNLILRHVTSKRQKEIVVDLKLAPMVMEELPLLGGRPASGPIIIEGRTGLPFRNYQFRRKWRDLADACSIPKSVKNMDTRAGAITEATDSGASIEDVRHAATHSNVAMTQRYSRNQEKKTATVMELRVKSRNKPRT